MFVRRLLPATCIEGALSQFISPKLVARCCRDKSETACLISRVAEEAERNILDVLYEVADRLDLTPCPEVRSPSPELLAQTGHSIALMRERGVIPQSLREGGSGYELIVANPAVVDVSRYQQSGIQVLLGLRSAIDEAWERFEFLESNTSASRISDEQFESVMLQLAHDALDKGACEVFVGHPEPSGYEFLVGERRYTGRLDPRVYRTLLQYFTADGRLQHRVSRPVVSPAIETLHFSLTKNVNNPVVYLSWKLNSNDAADTPLAPEGAEEEKNLEVTNQKEFSQAKECEAIVGASVSINPRSILLVDDDERFGSLLLRILEGRGFEVHHCENGKEALEYLTESQVQPSLIVSDVHMPTMDGVAFLQQIRNLLPTIPVLMLTSDEDDLLQVELVELGANAFVRKQDDIKILIAWCNNLITTRDDSFEHTIRVTA